MQTTSIVDWKTLQPLLAENVALKRKILNLCELPLHRSLVNPLARKLRFSFKRVASQIGFYWSQGVVTFQGERLSFS